MRGCCGRTDVSKVHLGPYFFANQGFRWTASSQENKSEGRLSFQVMTLAYSCVALHRVEFRNAALRRRAVRYATKRVGPTDQHLWTRRNDVNSAKGNPGKAIRDPTACSCRFRRVGRAVTASPRSIRQLVMHALPSRSLRGRLSISSVPLSPRANRPAVG